MSESSHPRRQDYEVVDFENVEEVWNEYELGDGNRIKGRVILLQLRQVFDKPTKEGETYDAEFQSFYRVYAPMSSRGTPNMPTTKEEIAKIPKIPTRTLTTNERWNVYRIIKNGKIFKLKLVVDEIYRLQNTFDSAGMPYYEISAGEMFVPGKDTKTYSQ